MKEELLTEHACSELMPALQASSVPTITYSEGVPYFNKK